VPLLVNISILIAHWVTIFLLLILAQIHLSHWRIRTAYPLLKPDIILVSCFSRKIPDLIYSIPTLGSFNLHPSLLPEYQGPDPLFWQFRAEKCVFGVSLHRITAGLDRGNIVLQKTLVMPEGISKQDATHLLAHTAGELALRLVETIHQKPLAEIPQNPALMSYQGLAHANDYIVSHTWTARRLYNFICAYQQAGRYFQCRINSDRCGFTASIICRPALCHSFCSIPFRKNQT